MGEREESMEEVRWERLLPRMPVRVLVVEGDDSTRQIITALLRKCGYRVVSVADGLKAWEMLTEKACYVDLVLTEVELPAISGFSLLSMIAEHENYKNIPVIMMSSHDSISMVFKCMLRGAVDFLVKPIRKNELRNLWQHVWRRHYLSSGKRAGSQCNQDEKPVNGDMEANVENNTSSYSSEYVVCMDKNEDNTEKGSDAQSSCTRSDAEAESQCMKSMQESKHPMGKPLIFLDTKISQNGDDYDMVSLKHAAETEDKSVTWGPECNSSEVVAADNGCSAVAAVKGDLKPINCVHIDNNTTDEAKPKEAIDLIGAIDNHPQYSFARDRTAANDLLNVSEDVPEKHININPSSVPLLELSLRRTPQTSHGKQENDESNTLNHSNSSAFSLYTNRTPFHASPIPLKFVTEREKLLSPWMKSQVVQVSGNTCEGETLNSMEDTGPSGSGTTNQDETSLHHSLRTIPFPVPIMWQANGPLLQPMFTPQSSNPYLSAMPTMWEEARHPNSTDQTVSGELDAMQCEQLPTYNSADKQQEITEIRDEQGDVSSAMVDCDNSTCADAPNVLSVETGKPEEPFVHDEIRQMDFIRLNQREAALNKYRLKRKDRCYGKKVRYQSRKLLAEQRPRVKGQFVRQVQHYSSDSVTA